jgi:amino-acid N-acetyltransferase
VALDAGGKRPAFPEARAAMTIRSAQPGDLGSIVGLLEDLRLPSEGVRDHLKEFLVFDEDGAVVGTVGLEVYGDRALLRSLGVARARQGLGRGHALCDAILARARALGMVEIVLLTETASGFFARRGFESIPRDRVDEAVRRSVEFRSACPASATCMRLRLEAI